MLVNLKNFVDAFQRKDTYDAAMAFARAYGNCSLKAKQREDYLAGKISFRFAEMQDAGEQTKKEFVNAVHESMRMLNKLNTLYALETLRESGEKRFITARTESFEDYLKVLECFESFGNNTFIRNVN